MGVAISNWTLARAVAIEGQMGVVSGTGIDTVLTRRLQLGDIGGHIRRAFDHFPIPEIAEQVWERYFVSGGKDPDVPFKSKPVPGIKAPKAFTDLVILAAVTDGFFEWVNPSNEPYGIGRVQELIRALRDEQDLRFELSLGVSGVHYPQETGRELHAVHHLFSITHTRALRVEVVAPDADPHVPSAVGVYPTCDWHERETWDFFGIVFDGHPSLARIAMPDDWPGHPQRKDYPLGGIPVEYKGATTPPPDQRRAYN